MAGTPGKLIARQGVAQGVSSTSRWLEAVQGVGKGKKCSAGVSSSEIARLIGMAQQGGGILAVLGGQGDAGRRR